MLNPAPQPQLPLEPDEWTLPRQSAAVRSLAYLQWVDTGAGDSVHVAISAIQGACIMVCQFNTADNAVRRSLAAANLIVNQMGRQQCSAILNELHAARIFETVYDGEPEFFVAVRDSTLVDHSRLQFQPTWIVSTDPFDRPAVQAQVAVRGRAAIEAQPAINGPAELRYLALTSWLALITEGDRQGSGQGPRVLGRAIALLSHRSRSATRDDEMSDLRAIAATLATYVRTWASLGAAATAAQLARHTPAYLAANMAVVPLNLGGACGTAAACETELRDGHTLLQGRESESSAVIWARLYHNLHRFAVLSHFKSHLPNSGAAKEVLERLMMGISVPVGSPLVRAAELARELERRGKDQMVKDLFAAGSDARQVVEEILDSHSTTAGSATVPDSGAAEGHSTSGGMQGGSMDQHEFDRAVTSPNFVTAVEEMKDTTGVTLIDKAATAGSVILLRYLFSTPAWMRARHPAFDLLGKNIMDRRAYLAFCVAVDADSTEVPARLATYTVSQTINDSFWACKWSEIDMVNASKSTPSEGGFLALRYLQQGSVYDVVDKADHFTVEAALLGVRDWFARLLYGVGF